MTAKQLGKIIEKFVDYYAQSDVTDEQVDDLIRLLPYYFNDLIYQLDKQEIYLEKDKNGEWIYIEPDEKNYQIDKERTNLDKGEIYFIKAKKGVKE